MVRNLPSEIVLAIVGTLITLVAMCVCVYVYSPGHFHKHYLATTKPSRFRGIIFYHFAVAFFFRKFSTFLREIIVPIRRSVLNTLVFIYIRIKYSSLPGRFRANLSLGPS